MTILSRKLLLISGSKTHGTGYLDHCEQEIRNFLGQTREVVFVPYARPDGMSHDEYTAIARARFESMGYNLKSVHESSDPFYVASNARAFFVGGGNTFVLLDQLFNTGVISMLRDRCSKGVQYIGVSAGANVAGPTIMTTNDMPVVHPDSLEALRLVPFQINPHYFDPDPASKHQGETREQRIREYHAFNKFPVVGLREGSMLSVGMQDVLLKGESGARVFTRNKEPVEYRPGDSLNFLLE